MAGQAHSAMQAPRCGKTAAVGFFVALEKVLQLRMVRSMATKRTSSGYIRWFDEIGIDDIPLVGGKNASLGEMYRELPPRGVKIPNGFAVTADAYRYSSEQSGLERRLREILEGLDTRDMDNLRSRGQPGPRGDPRCRAAGRPGAGDPRRLRAARRRQRRSRSTWPCDQRHGRGSARRQLRRPAGNLPERPGRQLLLETCKRCFASLFTDRAISYRVDKGFDHLKVGLSIGVQRWCARTWPPRA